MSASSPRRRWGKRFVPLVAAAGLVTGTLTAVLAPSAAAADTTTYTATQTIPVPPATSYAGGGGGDGWSVALTDDAVFNVFHHNYDVTIACHLQSDASECWQPKTIVGPHPTDANTTTGYAVGGHSGLIVDDVTEKAYVYATRQADSTGGVVCVDTVAGRGGADPFCGFTALTAVGEAQLSGNGTLGVPMTVGSRWFAFNYVNGSASTGTRNTLLCFDLKTKAGCANQPFAVEVAVGEGAGTFTSGSFPEPSTGAIGTRLLIPVVVDGVHKLACFDAVGLAECSGSWPAPHSDVAGFHGSPFPLLTAQGAVAGVCVPMTGIPCWDLAGAPVETPAALAATIAPNEAWNGEAVVIGPRVYVPVGGEDQVQCYDFNRGESCLNFPKSFENLGYLYTVNPDPQRPDCLWVNADYGSAQIQNFDAYTGAACGTGAIRVLASRIVVPAEECTPNEYQTLELVEPEPDSYTSGTVSFLDVSGQPIEGAADRPVEDGVVDLTGLSLNTDAGLPQFLITLNESGAPSQVVVKLTWTSSTAEQCRPASVVTLTPASGTTGDVFKASYSCTTTPTLSILNADASPATGVVAGEQTQTGEVDYATTLDLQPGSYLASVLCNGQTTRSDVAVVAAPSPSPSPSLSESPSPAGDPGEPPVFCGRPCIDPSPSPSETQGTDASPTTSPTPTRAPLNLFAPEQYLLPGRAAQLRLTGEPNTPVDLECYTRPSTTYVVARNDIVLDGNGETAFQLLLGASTRCYAHYSDGVGAPSGSALLQVHTAMLLSSVERIDSGEYVFHGRLQPAVRNGRYISLWRLGLGNPVLQGRVLDDGSGTFHIPVRFVGRGSFQFVATVPANLNHASGTSNIVNATIT